MGITSIVIERSVPKVFARVADFDRAREWAPQMGRIHMEGPIREGATFLEERKVLGRTFTAKWAITRYEPDEALGLTLSFGPLRGRFAYLFEPAGSGTRLTQMTEIGFAGPLDILSSLVAGEAQKEEDAELARLKELLERG